MLYWSLLMQYCPHLATVALEQAQHWEGWLSVSDRPLELAWCVVRPWGDPQPCEDQQINNKIRRLRPSASLFFPSPCLLFIYLFSVPGVELRTLLVLGKCFVSLSLFVYLMCMSSLPACVSVLCHMHTWCPLRFQEDFGSPRTRITDDSEPHVNAGNQTPVLFKSSDCSNCWAISPSALFEKQPSPWFLFLWVFFLLKLA